MKGLEFYTHGIGFSWLQLPILTETEHIEMVEITLLSDKEVTVENPAVETAISPSLKSASFAKTPHERDPHPCNMLHASLYVIDFRCAPNFGDAQGRTHGPRVGLRRLDLFCR